MAPTPRSITNLAMSQTGDRYIFGREVSPTESNPSAFDCSELVEWVCAREGVSPRMPDGSYNQYLHAKRHGTLISVHEAAKTEGALLFWFRKEPQPGAPRTPGSHVAISRGNGLTIEARSARYGVGSWKVAGRFNYAALIPGVNYEKEEPPVPTYRGVRNVTEDWQKKVVDWGIKEGVIITGDAAVDDWDDDDLTMGRLWTLLYRESQ